MSFSSRRRNYLLTPHRRDGLIEWMKSMLMHSFVLDALDTTGADTFSHFEMLIDEHIALSSSEDTTPSRLKQLVPTVGLFHTRLPLRKAFEAYNLKHYLTKRKHITISFNEIRHILNLAQVMALAGIEASQSHASMMKFVTMSSDGDDSGVGDDESPCKTPDQDFVGPKLITFDGDQTLYSDGANFESNRQLAHFMYLLLKHGVTVAVVTAAGYEYQTEKYEHRLSGLLTYFSEKGLSEEHLQRFYLFGGECNYLLRLGSDYRLHAVPETGPGGWMTSTMYLQESPGNWSEAHVTQLLDVAERSLSSTQSELHMRSRIIRKRRAVGLIPISMDSLLPREVLDETVLVVQSELSKVAIELPFCAFNGGRDVWVDVGNKRVGVQILQSYTGISTTDTLHIGDQFLNTGNDYAARDVCPCIWITSPIETTYILKSILRLANISLMEDMSRGDRSPSFDVMDGKTSTPAAGINFSECERRTKVVKKMD
eukprot:CAMPEP_0119009962 /NCGR_PEP_ID=MMETSP1176-20130426/4705_1 /TAXON_ID=265551 /ORGANISM="Synedropsis recta cf, Strain CCMP1620" /LENGTH=483 /DNA_ID=CAMNT_0006962547 /DNA_START=1 /DNA_END=1449 /DNA_ORIENTATION=+